MLVVHMSPFAAERTRTPPMASSIQFFDTLLNGVPNFAFGVSRLRRSVRIGEG